MPGHRNLFIALFVAILAISTTTIYPTDTTLAFYKRTTAILKPISGLFNNYNSNITNTTSTTTASIRNTTTMSKRTPVYFVSHGGPDTMYDSKHPVWPYMQAMGREITQKVKPKAIVVFSAHWQSDLVGGIQINTSEEEPLLYDYYGFPRHYYAEKFPNKGSTELANRVIDLLTEAGIKAQGTDRGLDHGVFVPFKVMFNDKENPVTVPIVQVSLFDDDTNAAAHIKLGRAVEKLRDEGVCIIVSGMAVHNLRHLIMLERSGQGSITMPYAVSFDDALKAAVQTKPGEARDKAMEALLKRPDARQAHPTFEHLLPIHVGVGAAGNDEGKQIWTLPEGSMSWAQYRFGEVEA